MAGTQAGTAGSSPEALVVTRGVIAALMSPADYLEAVEAGFRSLQQGMAEMPAPLAIEAIDGAFHAKGARLALDRTYVALKLNGNFPINPGRTGLPTVQGVIILSDGANGSVLAVMDSIEITLRRTAAASALAARLLARPDSRTLTICGCGEQAMPHVEAMRGVFGLTHGFCWDREPGRAEFFAARCAEAGLPMQSTDELGTATRSSDIIVTCTTASRPFLAPDMIQRGTFIAAVGADHPAKSEIEPELMAKARVVTDSTDQCLSGGDLHHAVRAGAMQPSDVHGELGALLCGEREGRTDPDTIFLFDSTGTAVQDVASAALIYERAVAGDVGTAIALAE